MARALVTGGAGFIGSHLVDALVARGDHVTVIDDLSVGRRSNVRAEAEFTKLSILSDPASQLIKRGRFDVIFHCAAQKNLQYSKTHPLADARTNIIGSLRVIEAAKVRKKSKIIFYSTAAVYSPLQSQPVKESGLINPVTPYGIGKLTAVLYLKQSGVRFTILRLSNVYGPRQDARGEGGVVAIFCDALKHNHQPKIFNRGDHTRDYIYVSDVVRASITAIRKADRETVNVSTAKQTSVLSLFKIVRRMAGGSVNPRYGGPLAEQPFSALSNSRAKKLLGWYPQLTVREGIRNVLNSNDN